MLTHHLISTIVDNKGNITLFSKKLCGKKEVAKSFLGVKDMLENLLDKLTNNEEDCANIVLKRSGAGTARFFIKPIITVEIKKRNHRMMCNNYRKMHRMPLIRKGSDLYKIKCGMIFEMSEPKV